MIQYGRNAIVLAIDEEGSRTDEGAVDVAITTLALCVSQEWLDAADRAVLKAAGRRPGELGNIVCIKVSDELRDEPIVRQRHVR